MRKLYYLLLSNKTQLKNTFKQNNTHIHSGFGRRPVLRPLVLGPVDVVLAQELGVGVTNAFVQVEELGRRLAWDGIRLMVTGQFGLVEALVQTTGH